jgi:hypothetical protein
VPCEQTTADRAMLVELYGMLATMDKREAEVLQRCADREKDRNPTRKARELLLSAQQHYKKGLRHDRANHWLATQYLFLCAILGQKGSRSVADWMTLARFSAREETREGTPSQRAWAYASLLELAVLGLILGIDAAADAEDRLNKAREDADAMLALVGMRSFEVYSTLRQFERYALWSGLQRPDAAQRVIEEIRTVLAAEGELDRSKAPVGAPSLSPPQNDVSDSSPPKSDAQLVGAERPTHLPNGVREAT